MAFTLVQLQAWLLDAQTARHQLLTGRMAVSVTYDGKAVTYTHADLYKLDAYIADLNRQILLLTGPLDRRVGPVQFSF